MCTHDINLAYDSIQMCGFYAEFTQSHIYYSHFDDTIDYLSLTNVKGYAEPEIRLIGQIKESKLVCKRI